MDDVIFPPNVLHGMSCVFLSGESTSEHHNYRLDLHETVLNIKVQ